MKETFINNTFLETIRTYRTTFTWTSEGVDDIVFEGLTHQHLLRTNIIDKTIIDYYISYTIDLLTPSEVENLPRDYHSKIFSLALAPFPFVILGAYHSRFNLYFKVKSLIKYNNKIELHGSKKFNNFFDLKAYFSEYAIGFKDGLNDFEDDKIIPYLLKFETNSKEAYITKVFEFLTKNGMEAPRTTSKKGFSLFSKDKLEIVDAYQDGLLEGYIYRAWNIIFSNNELFTPIFKKYRNHRETEKTKVLEKDVILKMDNNLISDVSLLDVYDFFSVLTKLPKQGNSYLCEQKLLIFIESTFVNKKPILQSFDVSLNKAKKNVRSVFKRFQDNCYQYERNKKHLKEKYFSIMFEGFEGFSKKSDYDKWHVTNDILKTIDKPSENYRK